MKKRPKKLLHHERIRWFAVLLAGILVALAAFYAYKLYTLSPA